MGVYTDMVAAAKLRVGRVSQVEMLDDEIWLLVLPDVVREWSNLVPRIGMYTVSLSEGQTLYDLPASTVFEITDWSDINEDEIATTILGDEYVQGSGLEFYYSSPLLMDYARELARGSQVDTVRIQGGQIEVIPTPDSAVTIFIRTHDLWTFADEDAFDTFPEIYRTPFTALLAANLADNLAAEAGNVPEIRIGNSVTKVNYQKLEALAKSERERCAGMIDADEMPILHE